MRTETTRTPPVRWRSGLFAAATRVGFLDKAVAVGADLAIVDLEDAVPELQKAVARDQMVAAITTTRDRGAMLVVVRVNGLATEHFVADVAAAVAAGADGIVVPMLEDAAHVHFVRGALAMAGSDDGLLIGGIETVRGVEHAVSICEAGLSAVYFGAEDFVTDLGGTRTADNAEVAVARSRVRFAARGSLIAALDQVVTDVVDTERFEREAYEARNLGFSGKLCIHPAQVDVANRVFSPSRDEIGWAGRVVDAAENAARSGEGVAVVDGQMIDEPIIVRARQILGSAEGSA